MISRTLNTFLLVLAMSNLLLPLAVGAEAPLPEVELGIVTCKEINPERKIGYTVGDILQRTIVLDIKQPYKLVGTSLPIVGYEKRWKNQLTGIELNQISHTQQAHANSTTHTLQLAYQVFTNANVAKHARCRMNTFNWLPTVKLCNTASQAGILSFRPSHFSAA